MSVDVRTRVDGPAPPVDATDFFETDLPRAFVTRAAQLAPGVAAMAPKPLAIDVEGATWTLVADTDTGEVAVRPGPVDGAGTLHLGRDQLTDLVQDQSTPMTWFSGGTLHVSGVRLDDTLDWWVVLRGALDGRAPYVSGSVRLDDADGHPLDLTRSFAPDDPVEAQRDFLERAGYLHLAGVYSEGEMAAVSADMDRVAPEFILGDGRSWWARTADGADRLVRMQSFDQLSDATASLVADDRLQRLGHLTGDGHLWATRDTNRIEALFKPVGVVEGISDVPWHRDCTLGRHSYECCRLTVGISVTGADERSGQLRVVAGSHRALTWPGLLRRDLDLPVVALPTSTGDVTVHLSCTLHMAQPPVDRERRVLYTDFFLPDPDPSASLDARRRLRAVREAAPVTVSQPASSVAPQ